MYPAIKTALPKSGITSYISTPIRDGPITSGCVGVISLYKYQNTTRTTMVIEQERRKTPTGFFYLLA